MEHKAPEVIVSRDVVTLVTELILKNFKFLEDKYAFKFKVNQHVDDPLFMNKLLVVFSNTTSRRRVSITYTQSEWAGEINNHFSACIFRLPYQSWEDYFSLREYLRTIEQEVQRRVYGEPHYNEIDVVLHTIADTLDAKCADILAGEVWYEEYYPRAD
jgi:hypothetical protein